MYYALAALPACRHYKAAMSSQPKILLIAAFSLPSCYGRFLIFFVCFFFQEIFDFIGGQNVLKNIQAQLNGTYFLGQTIKVTILENECDGFLSIISEELAKQLAKFTQVEVSLLVSESTQIDHWYKRRLEEDRVTILKAKSNQALLTPLIGCIIHQKTSKQTL